MKYTLGNLQGFQDGVEYGCELIKKNSDLAIADRHNFYAKLIILGQGGWKQYQVSLTPRWLPYDLAFQDGSHTLWIMLINDCLAT